MNGEMSSGRERIADVPRCIALRDGESASANPAALARDTIIRDGPTIAARILAGEHIAAIAREYGNHIVIVRRVYRQHTTAAERRRSWNAKLAESVRRSGRAFTGKPRQHLGTIAIHMTSRGILRRQIKVDERGPARHHWMNFSVFAWLMKENRAEVPRGFRVAHADGDALNDDPANLMLMRDEWAFEHVRCLHPEIEEQRLAKADKFGKGAKTRAKHSAMLEVVRSETASAECKGCGNGERPRDGRCRKCGGSVWLKLRRVAA